MRTLTTTEQRALASGHYKPIVRVYVEDADGSFVALHDLRGYDWVDTVDITSDIDTPVEQLSLTLFRDVYQMGMSPLKEDSALNIDGVGAYAPLLDAGRRLWIETPLAPLDSGEALPYIVYLFWTASDTVAADRTLTASDTIDGSLEDGSWITRLLGREPTGVGEDGRRYTAFEGVIDEVDWSQTRVEVVARDLGGDLQLAFIEEEQVYGDDGGSVLAEDVMRSILDDNGFPLVAIDLPDGASNLGIKEYEQQHQHIMQALQDVALQRGWVLRYKFNESTLEYKLTFYDPGRGQTVPDVTVGPDQYIDVRRLSINRIPVRNVVRVTYTDVDDERQTVTAEDANSISRYGRLFMGLTEASSSQINTQSSATVMAQAIRDDRKDPKAEQEIEMHYRYDLELTDLVRWQANGVHYTTDQDLAIVSIRHSLSGSSHRTHVTVRGTPAGAYTQWMLREERGGIGNPVNLTPPHVPVNVVASGIRGGVAVSVDTPRWRDRWDRTEVHISETPDFTPSALTLADSGRKTTFEITEGLDAETTYYVRLVNVDRQNMRSDPSIQVSTVSGELIPEGSITTTNVFVVVATDQERLLGYGITNRGLIVPSWEFYPTNETGVSRRYLMAAAFAEGDDIVFGYQGKSIGSDNRQIWLYKMRDSFEGGRLSEAFWDGEENQTLEHRKNFDLTVTGGVLTSIVQKDSDTRTVHLQLRQYPGMSSPIYTTVDLAPVGRTIRNMRMTGFREPAESLNRVYCVTDYATEHLGNPATNYGIAYIRPFQSALGFESDSFTGSLLTGEHDRLADITHHPGYPGEVAFIVWNSQTKKVSIYKVSMTGSGFNLVEQVDVAEDVLTVDDNLLAAAPGVYGTFNLYGIKRSAQGFQKLQNLTMDWLTMQPVTYPAYQEIPAMEVNRIHATAGDTMTPGANIVSLNSLYSNIWALRFEPLTVPDPQQVTINLRQGMSAYI